MKRKTILLKENKNKEINHIAKQEKRSFSNMVNIMIDFYLDDVNLIDNSNKQFPNSKYDKA